MAKKPASDRIPGKSRGKRKLLDEQVKAIVAAYQGRGKGPTMKDLAAQFSVAIGTVSSIISGRTYAWLTGIGCTGALAA